ncbi:MAG: 1-(5-phosphoribosyl)-5-[(5-phosphoribosylamino)methylideneamino]imidazole-4-carboxamide isomerase [Candidatus Omnitrophica bacterium]|nr:1-(5-phosphoribosyl)-5-[(5-phosphoribosylamino)methylideneamino]imidazole-4-carboxamide isomerase [Candidatus Omnitrophota bacterium]
MLVIPAIDLKDGIVVRLLQGKFDEMTVYAHDPAETAKAWEKQGANRLHIVDLDGARTGGVTNVTAARQIIEGVNIPVQFGGGLRTREDIDAIISIGAKWAILGTKACEDLDFVKKVVSEFGEQIIVSIDVKYKKVATRGWTETSAIEDVELIKRLQDVGVKSFIYTDISRDGTLTGINIEGIKRVLEETGASVIYSGGVSTMEDIKNLNPLEKQGLVGIIIGKALYENKIGLTQVKTFLEKK